MKRSSESKERDDATIAVLRKAAPFAALPKEWNDHLTIQITFGYRENEPVHGALVQD